MAAMIVVAAFVALVVIWSQSGAPSQIRASADDNGPRLLQDGATALTP